jgi:anti-sigma factor RsiW
MTELSDELLMAYIDGQLDKPQASVVGHMLHRDSDLAQRVRRMQETQARFLELFGALVREGPASAPRGARAKASRSDRNAGDASGLVTAGVAALLVVFGASLGFTTAYFSGMSREASASTAEDGARMPPANWSEDIAELHAYFTPETLTAGRDSQANPDVVRFQLAKLSSHAVILPDFSQSGLRFVRAQTLSYRGNRLMQLVYTGKSDPLVAVYITAGDGEGPVSPGRFGDVKTVSWSAGGLRYLIAADMTQEALRALAAIAQSQLPKG